MSPLALFSQIFTQLNNQFPNLDRGKLLSAPSLEYKGRAFAVCQDGHINLKLRDSDCLLQRGIYANGSYKAFGKLKMDAWVQVPFYFSEDWHELATLALEDMQEQLG